MRSVLSVLLVGVLGDLVAASQAFAQQPNGKGTDLFVANAARECSSYSGRHGEPRAQRHQESS